MTDEETSPSSDEGPVASPALETPLDEETLPVALDALDDVFYVYDSAYRLVQRNRRLNDLFDCEDDALYGRRPESFFVAEDRDRVRAAAREAIQTGRTLVEADAETVDGGGSRQDTVTTRRTG